MDLLPSELTQSVPPLSAFPVIAPAVGELEVKSIALNRWANICHSSDGTMIEGQCCVVSLGCVEDQSSW